MPLRGDAATSHITSNPGTRLVGGFASYPAQVADDAPHACCLVLDDGKTRIALVVCDFLGLPHTPIEGGLVSNGTGRLVN